MKCQEAFDAKTKDKVLNEKMREIDFLRRIADLEEEVYDLKIKLESITRETRL